METTLIRLKANLSNMADYYLSLNQLAEFSVATDAVKRRIIRQQLSPDPFRLQWYKMARACIRASIRQNCDPKPIYDGLMALSAKTAITKRQQSDKATSIEALERFLNLKLPLTLRSMNYTTVKPLDRTVEFSDVEITVAPEIVIRGELGGKKVVGGMKIHICKGKPFDYEQSLLVATVISEFLKAKVASQDELVMPELCFSVDIFGDRIVQAPHDLSRVIRTIDEICNEVKVHWLAA